MGQTGSISLTLTKPVYQTGPSYQLEYDTNPLSLNL